MLAAINTRFVTTLALYTIEKSQDKKLKAIKLDCGGQDGRFTNFRENICCH